ncbi:MAG TPA: hypothetical protein VGI12_16170 [Vicinamibacterales bacterium]
MSEPALLVTLGISLSIVSSWARRQIVKSNARHAAAPVRVESPARRTPWLVSDAERKIA